MEMEGGNETLDLDIDLELGESTPVCPSLASCCFFCSRQPGPNSTPTENSLLLSDEEDQESRLQQCLDDVKRALCYIPPIGTALGYVTLGTWTLTRYIESLIQRKAGRGIYIGIALAFLPLFYSTFERFKTFTFQYTSLTPMELTEYLPDWVITMCQKLKGGAGIMAGGEASIMGGVSAMYIIKQFLEVFGKEKNLLPFSGELAIIAFTTVISLIQQLIYHHPLSSCSPAKYCHPKIPAVFYSIPNSLTYVTPIIEMLLPVAASVFGQTMLSILALVIAAVILYETHRMYTSLNKTTRLGLELNALDESCDRQTYINNFYNKWGLPTKATFATSAALFQGASQAIAFNFFLEAVGLAPASLRILLTAFPAIGTFLARYMRYVTTEMPLHAVQNDPDDPDDTDDTIIQFSGP